MNKLQTKEVEAIAKALDDLLVRVKSLKDEFASSEDDTTADLLDEFDEVITNISDAASTLEAME